MKSWGLWSLLLVVVQALPYPEGLSLEQARHLALMNSPALRLSSARHQESQFKVDEARSAGQPTLKLVAGFSRLSPTVEPPLAGQQLNINPEFNSISSLRLRQSLLTFGRLHWSTKAAELNERARRAEFKQQSDEVLEKATLSYFEALLSLEQVEISKDLVKAREAHLQTARNRVNSGVSAPFEIKRNLAALAHSQQQHLESTNRARLERLRLFSMLQLPDQGQILLPLKELPDIHPEDASRVMDRRPDLAALRWLVESAVARVQQSNSERNPDLYFLSDYTLRNPTSFLPSQQWSVGLQLEIPLFDGGLQSARSGQRQAIVEQLQAEYNQAERQARLDLEELLLAARSNFERLKVLQVELDSAYETIRIVRLRYQNGLGTNVELLDGEAAYTGARQDHTVARYRYLQSVARYRRAAAQPFEQTEVTTQ